MSSLETWPQELVDFALVSKDDVVLHCHKARLIENSEYFKAMLSHKVRETDENQMVVRDYDGVTVASFLEWIYAAELGEDIVKKLKKVAEPGEFISQRRFDEKKFSPELLKMSHQYQMSCLESDCEDYLQRTVSKENAVEAWKAAGTSGSQKLREKALTTMAKNHTKGVENPELKDQVIGLEEMLDWVVSHTTIKEEEGKDDKARGAGQDHVKVKFRSEIMTFYFNPDDTYLSFKTKLATKIQRSKFVLRHEGAQSGGILVNIHHNICNDLTLREFFGNRLIPIQNGQLLEVVDWPSA